MKFTKNKKKAFEGLYDIVFWCGYKWTERDRARKPSPPGGGFCFCLRMMSVVEVSERTSIWGRCCSVGEGEIRAALSLTDSHPEHGYENIYEIYSMCPTVIRRLRLLAGQTSPKLLPNSHTMLYLSLSICLLFSLATAALLTGGHSSI